MCRRKSVELWVQPVCSDGSWVKVEPCVLCFRAEELQCSCCCQSSAVSPSSGTDSCYFPQLCPSQWNLLVQDLLDWLCSWSYSDSRGHCKGNFIFVTCFLRSVSWHVLCFLTCIRLQFHGTRSHFFCAHFPCSPKGANVISSAVHLWFRDANVISSAVHLWFRDDPSQFSALFQSMLLRKGVTHWCPSKLDLQHKQIWVCAGQNQHPVPCQEVWIFVWSFSIFLTFMT